jgi:glycosyltransferase involved in cell wall biosynthesis
MDVAIVAPCPVPYVVGGAENLYRGLQDHINEHTPHQAELIKLPTREHSFWELVDSYRRFAELDLTGFDVVVSTKYPSWMVAHDRHVVYMLHKLRGLYDTWHFMGMPDRGPDDPPELLAFMDEHAGRRDALPELFARLEPYRGRGDDGAFAFPGPLIRRIVHFLDGIGLAPGAIHRYGAIAATVAGRAEYFPPGRDVFVAHPPTALPGLAPARRGEYLFTASRLDNPKRVALVVEALRHVDAPVELRVAGTGPEEDRIRELADGDPRVRMLGRVSSRELAGLYAGARAVAFVPYAEDYGYIALEAMLCGKPVITTTDSGGPTELVEDGVSGRVVVPTAEALGAAIEALWRDRRGVRRMGRAARERADRVTWDAVVRELLA